ncbi:MAG: DUF58 domain-containing protein [Planctomycetes bacterium]|nr:DUF58 domain-containing protein [Planctomycetota bacterium]
MPQRHGVRRGFEVGQGALLYFTITLLLLALAELSRASLLYWAFGVMIGVLAVSLLLSWLMLRGLRVHRLAPVVAVAGEPLMLRYSIANPHRWLPVFGLVIQETWGRGQSGWRQSGPIAESPARLGGRPQGWVLHIGAGETIQAEAVCVPRRRGELAFETIIVSTSFPFGIIRGRLTVRQEASVLVYPRLLRMKKAVLTRVTTAQPRGGRHTDRSGGHEDFFGLRDYRPGDSLKSVHWRSAAHTGRLVTREMTRPSPPEVMIALDLRRDGDAADADSLAVENAISLAASLVCDAHNHGCRVGLTVLGAAGHTYPLHHGLPHRGRILEALASLPSARGGEGGEPASRVRGESPATTPPVPAGETPNAARHPSPVGEDADPLSPKGRGGKRRTAEPNVIVVAHGPCDPHPQQTPRDLRRAVVLDAAQLDEFAVATPGGAEALLRGRVAFPGKYHRAGAREGDR